MKKGFTLIELMVVVVIIGILAALAIPKFLGATDKAKLSEWKNVTKQITTLQSAYKQYHDTYRPTACLSAITASPDYAAAAGVGGNTANTAANTALGFESPGSEARFHYGTVVATGTESTTAQAQLGAAQTAVKFGAVAQTVAEFGYMSDESVLSGSLADR